MSCAYHAEGTVCSSCLYCLDWISSWQRSARPTVVLHDDQRDDRHDRHQQQADHDQHHRAAQLPQKLLEGRQTVLSAEARIALVGTVRIDVAALRVVGVLRRVLAGDAQRDVRRVFEGSLRTLRAEHRAPARPARRQRGPDAPVRSVVRAIARLAARRSALPASQRVVPPVEAVLRRGVRRRVELEHDSPAAAAASAHFAALQSKKTHCSPTLPPSACTSPWKSISSLMKKTLPPDPPPLVSADAVLPSADTTTHRSSAPAPPPSYRIRVTAE